MDDEYKIATIETAKRALTLAGYLGKTGRDKQVYVDGAVIRTLAEHPDLDEDVLRKCLNQFGKQAFETRVASRSLELARQARCERARKAR
jgi:hypothetical protein